MTYGTLKYIVAGLLVGDRTLPNDDKVVKGLLAYAYNKISNKTESLHLLTLNKNKNIYRHATGDYLMRVPEMPKDDDDELDIDEELGYVAAEFIAGFISKDKKLIHDAEANELIIQYNGKVESILNAVRYNTTTKETYVE